MTATRKRRTGYSTALYGQLRKGSTAARVFDVLDAVGSWMTVDEILTELTDRFGEGVASDEAVRRSVFRHREHGRIEIRVVEYHDYDAVYSVPHREIGQRLGYQTIRRLEARAVS